MVQMHLLPKQTLVRVLQSSFAHLNNKTLRWTGPSAQVPSTRAAAFGVGIQAPSKTRRPGSIASHDSSPDVIFVLGGPGSGKGTQSDMLAKEFGVPHLCAGELLRELMQHDSPEGKMVSDLINAGQIVPSQVTVLMLQAAIDSEPAPLVLIDGFPRNMENVTTWEACSSSTCLAALNLELSSEEMMQRLLGRGQNRSDDNVETIRRRFQTFEEVSQPVLEYFRERNLLRNVSGSGTIDEVNARVREQFLAARDSVRK